MYMVMDKMYPLEIKGEKRKKCPPLSVNVCEALHAFTLHASSYKKILVVYITVSLKW